MDIAERPAERRTAALHLAILIVVAFVVIEAMPIKGGVVGGGIGIKSLFLARMAALVAVATWLLRREGRSWADVGLRRPLLWRTIAVVPLGLIVIGVATGLLKAGLNHFGLRGADYSAFAPLRGNLAEYLFWLIPVTIGSAAFGEEMIFRGFMRDAIERLLGGGRWGTAGAVLLQAVVFSLLHAYQGAAGIATTFLIGLLLGFAWWAARRNLWPGIIVHALLDGTAMTAIYLGLPVT